MIRFLKPGGLMLPTKANVYACPVSLDQFYQEKFLFWENVEGFDLSGLMPLAMMRAMSQPLIQTIEPYSLISEPKLFLSLDCQTLQVSDLKSFKEELEFVATKSGVFHGMCLWFDVEFLGTGKDEKQGFIFSTAPLDPPTHWKQTTILFPQAFSVEEGLTVRTEVTMEPSPENPRRYDLSVEVENPEDDGDEMETDIEAYNTLLDACLKGTKGENLTEED